MSRTVIIFRECPHCGVTAHIHVPEPEYTAYAQTGDSESLASLDWRDKWRIDYQSCPECDPEGGNNAQ